MKKDKVVRWDGYELDFSKKTYVMGILNLTPDSFSDGGKFNQEQEASSRAQNMVLQGAHIIDLGGESTRPGATAVEEEEELRRVLSPLKAVREAVNVPISIDTYKAKVADEAIKSGANIINDVWGCKADPRMAEVAARHRVPIILMHNRKEAVYDNLMDDIKADLLESIRICREAGVKEDKIILDPGIGFAKSYEENVLVMRNLEKVTSLGYPVLLGTSRKSLISKTLDLPVEERVEGTGATVCLGIDKGCDIVRVHDVLEISRMTKMMDVMIGKGDSPLPQTI
ncbi:dihydropteroate synthase [Salipaludibacillus aurantiacus]|uniref:Dihydropteroate synthase n=1 Tax=Salipaludibacillus aurantiacus TaxID=1601833 RepID=A0A1H9X4L1_9BACI|nr:dihydropteroate synthase [Salipaludibacillus aurantiacus]SES40971.1 dihydropteroate synthase [Salipaludibacillus aurantiacus]